MHSLRQLKDRYESLLKAEVIGSGDTLLDVGCGSASPIRGFSKNLKHVVGVDGFAPSIEKSRQAGIHHDYVQTNLDELDTNFSPRSFDIVTALDVIEHFEKPQAERLIRSLERIARKKVILFTPNGFLPQGEYDQNPFQLHRSGWEVGELEQMGYRVLGVNGWKPLRGEFAAIRFKPRRFWTLCSWLTVPWAEKRPAHAFQLLGIKEFPNPLS